MHNRSLLLLKVSLNCCLYLFFSCLFLKTSNFNCCLYNLCITVSKKNPTLSLNCKLYGLSHQYKHLEATKLRSVLGSLKNIEVISVVSSA